MSINEKIILLRKEKGLNTLTVSKMMNINNNVLYYIETGRNKPGADMIKKLCEFYNVSADWLLGLKEER